MTRGGDGESVTCFVAERGQACGTQCVVRPVTTQAQGCRVRWQAPARCSANHPARILGDAARKHRQCVRLAVVQWIEQGPPKTQMQVRFLPARPACVQRVSRRRVSDRIELRRARLDVVQSPMSATRLRSDVRKPGRRGQSPKAFFACRRCDAAQSAGISARGLRNLGLRVARRALSTIAVDKLRALFECIDYAAPVADSDDP
jgi:hypothetical protein